MNQNNNRHNTEIEFAAPPSWGIFRELAGFLEYPKNLWGWGDPVVNGNNDPVILVPGYRSGNSSMHMIQKYLTHNGFRAYHWSKDYNNGDVEVMLEYLKKDILEANDKYQSKVHLVGWSLGGYISREAARDLPGTVQSIVTLASPIYGGPKYTVAADEYVKNGFDIDEIEAIVTERNQNPLDVPITSLYTKNDHIVDWRACLDPHLKDEDQIEVNTTHLGIIWNPDVLKIIAMRLAKNLK